MPSRIFKGMAKLPGKEKPHRSLTLGEDLCADGGPHQAFSQPVASLSSEAPGGFGLMFSGSWQRCEVRSGFCLCFPQILKHSSEPGQLRSPSELLYSLILSLRRVPHSAVTAAPPLCMKNNPDTHLFGGRAKGEMETHGVFLTATSAQVGFYQVPHAHRIR